MGMFLVYLSVMAGQIPECKLISGENVGGCNECSSLAHEREMGLAAGPACRSDAGFLAQDLGCRARKTPRLAIRSNVGCETHAAGHPAIEDAGAARVAAPAGIGPVDANFAGLIDHTLLKPEATRADVVKLCEEARKHRFASVCVNTYLGRFPHGDHADVASDLVNWGM